LTNATVESGRRLKNMFHTPEELLEKIRLGEDSILELKRIVFAGTKITGPDRKNLSDEMAAFANRKGGTIVFGVDDKTKDILGIPVDKLDAVESFVREICLDIIKPELSFDLTRLHLPSFSGEMLPVVRLDIPQSLWVHKSAGGYFHRVGSSAKEMPPDYLGRLFQQRSQAKIIRFEEQLVPDANFEDLDSFLWKNYASPDEADPIIALRKIKMIGKDSDGIERPTVAGILLGSRHPEKFLPNAFIQAVHYRGVIQDSNYQMNARDITGPLDQQILDACHFFEASNTLSADKEMGRMDSSRFSAKAFFEAIVNAVAHRDYSIHYGKIRFFVFDDRIEIYSPGALVNSMEIDELPYRTGTRNETITNLLAKAKTDRGRALMEKRGDGVKTIIRETQKISGKQPIYQRIGDEELLLTIPS